MAESLSFLAYGLGNECELKCLAADEISYRGAVSHLDSVLHSFCLSFFLNNRLFIILYNRLLTGCLVDLFLVPWFWLLVVLKVLWVRFQLDWDSSYKIYHCGIICSNDFYLLFDCFHHHHQFNDDDERMLFLSFR